MPKISIPITKKVVTHKQATLHVTYSPGFAVVVRKQTRKKIAHKLFFVNQTRSMNKFVEEHRKLGNDVIIRSTNIITNL